jgi:pantothenate kinase
MLIDEINRRIDTILDETPDGSRFVLGIAGPPGVGKSTLAQYLVEVANARYRDVAVVAPMDGFHLSNELLIKRGLLALKGIPDTFDVLGFLAALEAVHKNQTTVGWPLFDRSIEASIPGGITIERHHKLVVAEGNYLLLNRGPWQQVATYLNKCWYLDASEEFLYGRLLQRHLAGGMSLHDAQKKVNDTDLANAALIALCGKGGATWFLSAEDLVLPKRS